MCWQLHKLRWGLYTTTTTTYLDTYAGLSLIRFFKFGKIIIQACHSSGLGLNYSSWVEFMSTFPAWKCPEVPKHCFAGFSGLAWHVCITICFLIEIIWTTWWWSYWKRNYHPAIKNRISKQDTSSWGIYYIFFYLLWLLNEQE